MTNWPLADMANKFAEQDIRSVQKACRQQKMSILEWLPSLNHNGGFRYVFTSKTKMPHSYAGYMPGSISSQPSILSPLLSCRPSLCILLRSLSPGAGCQAEGTQYGITYFKQVCWLRVVWLVWNFAHHVVSGAGAEKMQTIQLNQTITWGDTSDT